MSQSTVAILRRGAFSLRTQRNPPMHLADRSISLATVQVRAVVHKDDVLERMDSAIYSCELRQTFRRGHKHANTAVAEDVGDLLRPEQRVHRHEHAACGSRAEYRDDGLDALVEKHRHPIVASQSHCGQARRRIRKPGAIARHSCSVVFLNVRAGADPCSNAACCSKMGQVDFDR